MLAEGKEHARRVITSATQIRCSIPVSNPLGLSDQGIPPLLIKSFDELLELAQMLLAEQELYESRLHRSRQVDPASAQPTAHPQ